MHIVTDNTNLVIGIHWSRFNELHDILLKLERQKIAVDIKIASLKKEINIESDRALALEAKRLDP